MSETPPPSSWQSCAICARWTATTPPAGTCADGSPAARLSASYPTTFGNNWCANWQAKP